MVRRTDIAPEPRAAPRGGEEHRRGEHSASLPALVAVGGRTRPLAAEATPLELDRLLPGLGAWEMEIGFGKGRYLLARAAELPGRRFLGIEVVSRYFRLVARRAARRKLGNVAVIRGEAAYLLATHLPSGFARAIHAYFPDPWPKLRHHKRRLFDPERIDLLVSRLEPGGELFFATDHLEYGEGVAELLAAHPALSARRRDGGWPEGPRTHYEAKYVREGRTIVRLVARRRERAGDSLLHPAGAEAVLVAPRRPAAPAVQSLPSSSA